MTRKLRIGYVTTGSAQCVTNWSGLVKYIRSALVDCGHELHDVDCITPAVPIKTRIRGWQARFVFKKTYGYDRDVLLARSFAKQAERKLAGLRLDCIVAPRTYPVAMLETDLPVASWGDATFHALMELYPGYAEISGDSIRQGHYLERRAIQKCRFLAYASEWAANDAISFYQADPRKVAVIPFGANCPPPYSSLAEATAAIEAKPATPFKMLFVGAEWERKGGPLALSIQAELRRRGIQSELWIVGCNPFSGDAPPGVKCFGRLDKSKASEMATWHNCYRNSHVFLMPTRAECFGVVFTEAASFGLPSVATRVGGVPDAVADQTSGFLFAPEDGLGPYCDLLEKLASDSAFLREMALGSYTHYLSALNWRQSGKRFTEQLLELLYGHLGNC